jgi:hypothetical protein
MCSNRAQIGVRVSLPETAGLPLKNPRLTLHLSMIYKTAFRIVDPSKKQGLIN